MTVNTEQRSRAAARRPSARSGSLTSSSKTPAPQYELRVRGGGAGRGELEIWQLPAPASPHLRAPMRIAGLHGRNLELAEHRVLRRLAEAGIRPGEPLPGEELRQPLPEHLALTLGLLFRVLAPMRSRDNMRAVADGVEAMRPEEAAYWLGMAMHRPHPRRVLFALRTLLTEPKRSPVTG